MLRETLGEDSFRTKSDTEVILVRLTRSGGRLAWSRLAWNVCIRSPLGRENSVYFFVHAITSESSRFITRSSMAACTLSRRSSAVAVCSSDKDGYGGVQGIFEFPVLLSGGKTLSRPNSWNCSSGHYLMCKNGTIGVHRYWQVYYEPGF